MNAVELTQIGLRLGLTGEELKRWVQKELIAVEEQVIAIEEERIALELFTKEVKEKEEVVAQLRLKLHEVLLRKKFAQVNARSEAAALCFESRDAQGDKNDVKGSIAITELACLEQNVPLLTEVTGSDPMLLDTFLWDSSENGKSTMGSVTTLSTPGIDDNHSVTSTKVDASAASDADKDLQTSSLVNAEKKVLSRNDFLKSDNVVANSAGPWPEHSLFEEDKMIGTNIVGNDNSAAAGAATPTAANATTDAPEPSNTQATSSLERLKAQAALSDLDREQMECQDTDEGDDIIPYDTDTPTTRIEQDEDKLGDWLTVLTIRQKKALARAGRNTVGVAGGYDSSSQHLGPPKKPPEDLERRIRTVEFGSRKRVDDESSNPRINAYRRINNMGDVSDADNCDGGGMNVSNG
ncbi:hypothetical protein HPB49_004208 [Dermacentor silvarum]|uniref:Uncharacterized protein n=1 Tax=Dermacentor silvarum TaxID=543639 RepID=A0ACB8CV85_DERSI|nr:hypothetical protein HPB49_004208 [Dermacentor silvarum]